jgi:hypothetical protein
MLHKYRAARQLESYVDPHEALAGPELIIVQPFAPTTRPELSSAVLQPADVDTTNHDI